MTEFFETCASGPVLPASVLLTLVCIYWLTVIVGAVGMDAFDFDLDLDADADLDSILGLGAVGFRFLNLGTVPIMVWMSAFALSFWSLSIWLQLPGDDPTGVWAVSLIVGRNALISLIPTKILTQPLRGKFDSAPPNPDKGMIGRTGVVTITVTTTNGQIEIKTEAAPLVLHARVKEEEIAKGDRIVIVDYDSESRIFEVEKYPS